MATLLTVLGTGVYQPVSYHLASEPERRHPTRYAPVAAALVPGVGDAVVLLTAEARGAHWEAFRAELAALGIEARDRPSPRGGPSRRSLGDLRASSDGLRWRA